MHDTTYRPRNTQTLSEILNPFNFPVSKYLVLPAVAIYVLWTVALHVGLITQIGYTVGYGHFRGALALIPRIQYRVPVGLLTFYASQGDEVVVDYSIHDGGDGSLFFRLYETSSLLLKTSDFKSVGNVRSGTVRLKVKSAGLYALSISPTSVANKSGKRGYDLTFSASYRLIRH